MTEVTGRIYDAVVVGSGATGSMAAKELTEKGLEVLLLEAGRNISERDFPDLNSSGHPKGLEMGVRLRAALAGQHIQARFTGFSRHTRHLYVNDRQNPYTTPKDQFYLWPRGRQLGGRLHTWGRVVLRMSDYDFKAASRDGHGEDWPVTYQELAPYYDKVETFLGVYGTCERHPAVPDGLYVKAPCFTALEAEFKKKVEAEWPERRVMPLRMLVPNLKRVPLPVLAALETGRLTLRTDAVVKQITTDPTTGKADGVVFVDRNTREVHKVRAHVVVLCASTIESVRLLLNSACPKHPDGLGNSSGLLGRYFMDQCTSLVFGSIPGSTGWQYDPSLDRDPYVPAHGVYLPRFQNLGKGGEETFVRGYGIQATVGGMYAPDDQPSVFGMLGFGETLPYAENRISIDRNKRDAWGIPVAHVECRFFKNEHAMMRHILESMKTMARLCGFDIKFAGNPLVGLDESGRLDFVSRWVLRKAFAKSVAPGAVIHECGGARMGEDPSKSVLDPYNQCWDVKNLFVTDGSCCVSCGSVGHTLTSVALTARACEYIAKECTRGGL